MNRSTANIIDDAKSTLVRYGEVVEYKDFCIHRVEKKSWNWFQRRGANIIRKSDLKKVVSHYIKLNSQIAPPYDANFMSSGCAIKNKSKHGLTVELCVDKNWFLPYNMSKHQICFFYYNKITTKGSGKSEWSIIVDDSAVDDFIKSEHALFCMVDFSDGTALLYESAESISKKMEAMDRHLIPMAKKYRDILFMPIGDSIVMKKVFKVYHGDDKALNLKDFPIDDLINVFKSLRPIVKDIFGQNCYAVLTYGINKFEGLRPIFPSKEESAGTIAMPLETPKNLLQTKILSHAFKEMIKIEERCKTLRPECRGDMYMSRVLHLSERQHDSNKHQRDPQSKARGWIMGGCISQCGREYEDMVHIKFNN